MSLNWSTAKIANYAESFPDRITHEGKQEIRQWNLVTEALVWLAMMCGFNSITETNVDDITARVFAYEDAFGPMIKYHDGQEPIRAWQIRKHIGLSTNASSKTKAQFIKWLGTTVYNEAMSRYSTEKIKRHSYVPQTDSRISTADCATCGLHRDDQTHSLEASTLEAR